MATNTYVELRKETVAVATSSVSFDLTGISGYTDLEIVCNYASSNSLSFLTMQFNDDTAGNYALTSVAGNGSTLQTTQGVNLSPNWLGYQVGCNTTLGGTVSTIKLLSYANSHSPKNYLVMNGNSGVSTYTGIEHTVGLWNNTAPITKITFRNNTGGTFYNFAVGTTFSLYGIGGVGGDATPKALGGEVFSDSTHYYHLFKGVGTFEPLQSLSADILVVAGGGGAIGAGGGGGAGGLLGFTSQSLTAQRYPVLVGAGGAPGNPGTNTATNGNHSKFGSLTTALGGAYGAGYNNALYINAGTGGGSGGGGAFNSAGQFSNGTAGQGNSGNNGYQDPGGGAPRSGGGGGGAGGAATNGGVANTGGTGGIGATNGSTVGGSAGPYNFINAMGAATGTGQLSGGNYYYAGGGGGEGKNVRGAAGLGGGGIGGTSEPAQYPSPGTANTGGGAGAGPNALSSYGGAAGGSGVVIVRYAKV